MTSPHRPAVRLLFLLFVAALTTACPNGDDASLDTGAIVPIGAAGSAPTGTEPPADDPSDETKPEAPPGPIFTSTPTDHVVPRIADGPASFDNFGRAIAQADDLLVVSAYEDDDGGTETGSAFVYRRTPDGWKFLTWPSVRIRNSIYL